MKWLYNFISELEITHGKGMAIFDILVWGVFIFLLVAEILGYKITLIKK
jgi:hypothetical protein